MPKAWLPWNDPPNLAGRPIVVDTRKARAILALVAPEARPFARDELAAMFWPDGTAVNDAIPKT